MRTIKLKNRSLDKDWSMHFMSDEHYDKLIDETCKVVDSEGNPLFILLKNSLDPQLASNAYAALKSLRGTTENRGTASGIKPTGRVKKNGVVSKTTRVQMGWEVDSGIMGFFERVVRFPYARPCAFNINHHKKFEACLPLLQQCSGLFKSNLFERYEVQNQVCKRTNPAWVIKNTVYTTVTVNKNFRTAAHKDAGDLPEGFGNMAVLGEGNWSGAHLVFPNYKIAAKLDPLDFILFDPHEFHGNTPLAVKSKGAIRSTLVCYYRTKMQYCGSPECELKQAQNRKPGQPLFPEEK